MAVLKGLPITGMPPMVRRDLRGVNPSLNAGSVGVLLSSSMSAFIFPTYVAHVLWEVQVNIPA